MQQYGCSKISMEDSQNSRNKKLEEIKKETAFLKSKALILKKMEHIWTTISDLFVFFL